jgi:manganese efflux pump family protein
MCVNLQAIILIGIALSMDAFAVAITNGMTLRHSKMRSAFKISATFGLFQALMPMVGWLIGIKFSKYIVKVDHWIAFILLGIIGGKMIYEALKSEVKKENQRNEVKCLDNKTLLLLGLATSIDALTVGVSFACFQVPIIMSITIIGIITFILCFAGVFLGKNFGELLKGHAGIFGGIILVAIGLKIFIQHTNLMLFLKKFID